MERLTARDRLGFIHIMCGKNSTKWSMKRDIVRRLADYEDTGLEPEDILSGEELAEVACALNLLKDYQKIGGIDHLRELVQTEKDGRLVVLPCKVGDTVYLTDHEQVIKAEVTCMRPILRHGIEFRGNAVWSFEDLPHHDERILAQELFITFGKNAFMTREEAEAALKGENHETDL